MANVTQESIATELGISASTVSKVLSGRPDSGSFSRKTKAKIFNVAKKLNYEALGSARALATGRTRNIGFLLSSHITSGFGNSYFGDVLGGVQEFCKEQGYLCVVSTYDLSQIEKFVVPTKLRRKSVDGIIITGRVQREVLLKFHELEIPCVLVGEDGDYSRDHLITLDTNPIEKWTSMIGYLYGLGHRKFGIATLGSSHWIEMINASFDQFRRVCNDPVEYKIFTDANWKRDEYEFAREIATQWASMAERPTAMISHYQFCTVFLQVIQERGFQVPRDVSVLNENDTKICEAFYPSITSYSSSVSEHSRLAASLLIDLIENRMEYDEAVYAAKAYKAKGKIIIRRSTGPIFNGN